MSDKTPEQLANDTLTRENFSFADALKGRNYPEETVVVYLDDTFAYEAMELAAKVQEYTVRVAEYGKAVTADEKRELKALESLLADAKTAQADLAERLKGIRYEIVVKGVSTGFDEDALTVARAEYPVEYSSDLNAFTGATTRNEVPDPARDRYYTNLRWQGRIKQITSPSGAVDTNLSLESVAAIRRTLPKIAAAILADAIEKVDVAVEWYDALADEVFLAKS